MKRLGKGFAAELTAEHVLAAFEGREGRAAIPVEVVQPHQTPIGVLRHGIEIEQALRRARREREVAVLLVRRGPAGEVIGALIVEPFTPREQPVRKVGMGVELDVLEQRAERHVRRGALVQFPRVDPHVVRQADDVGGPEDRFTAAACEPTDDVHEVVPGGALDRVGPQQAREPRTGGGAFERDVRHEGERGAVQTNGTSVRVDEADLTEHLQPPRGFVAHDRLILSRAPELR